MGSNRFGVIFNEFELVIKSYTVAATTVSLQCISIPQKMQLTCERQSQRHAHSCGDWKTAARNSIFWNMCVDSICLGEHLFVNLDKSSGKKNMVWHRTERKKRKKNKVNGWFSEPFDYEIETKVLLSPFVYCHISYFGLFIY